MTPSIRSVENRALDLLNRTLNIVDALKGRIEALENKGLPDGVEVVGHSEVDFQYIPVSEKEQLCSGVGHIRPPGHTDAGNYRCSRCEQVVRPE